MTSTDVGRDAKTQMNPPWRTEKTAQDMLTDLENAIAIINTSTQLLNFNRIVLLLWLTPSGSRDPRFLMFNQTGKWG